MEGVVTGGIIVECIGGDVDAEAEQPRTEDELNAF